MGKLCILAAGLSSVCSAGLQLHRSTMAPEMPDTWSAFSAP